MLSRQGKGGTGRTFTGGVDALKFLAKEKQMLRSVALEAGWCSITIKEYRDGAWSAVKIVNSLLKV